MCIKQCLVAFLQEERDWIHVTCWSDFNNAIMNLFWKMTCEEYKDLLKIIKQIKHIPESGDIRELGFSQVRDHRVIGNATVQP